MKTQSMGNICFYLKPMINFMLDPKGEQPWYEETLAQDVAHLHAPKVY